MKNRKYYENRFRAYSDVLTVKQFRSMLGNMNEKMALQVLRDNLVKHFCADRIYYIPESYAIDYVLSENTTEYTKRRGIYGKQGSDKLF